MDILVIEPFYGGSHAQLINTLMTDSIISKRLKIYTLPAKKWHWKARASALHFMQAIEPSLDYGVLFTSSVLNLAELIALRPDLAMLRKVVYFHENQLVYPVRKHQDRDFHYGYSQITTCLVADAVIFNSEFNKESFLKSIASHLQLIPDHRPKNLEAKIRPKCSVLYFPIDFPRTEGEIQNESTIHLTYTHASYSNEEANSNVSESPLLRENVSHNEHSKNTQSLSLSPVFNCINKSSSQLNQETEEKIAEATSNNGIGLNMLPLKCDSTLHIVWPHRWEHDKDPEMFFEVLFHLLDEDYDFHVSVIGESYQEVPEIFSLAKSRLNNKVITWGFQSRDMYAKVLDSAHVAVSTAKHEFFGVSMLEATSRGCFPLCPKKLVYPEIYPDECLYSTQTQLLKCLKRFCKRPDKIRPPKINLEKFSWKSLQNDYYEMLKCVI